jgi:spoIIIJ-associated protein
MENLAQSAEKIANFMQLLTSSGGFQWKYRVTAGAGAADPDGLERRDIYVECKGPDVGLLLGNDGELLRALEHIANCSLRSDEHFRVSIDADGYKAKRGRRLRDAADAAIQQVKATGEPYRFAPMSSRDRRVVHLFLKESGLRTASNGEGAGSRCVVLYPEGHHIPTEHPDRDRPRGQRRPPRY